MNCPKCGRFMTHKALFTSMYWECDPCENPKPMDPLAHAIMQRNYWPYPQGLWVSREMVVESCKLNGLGNWAIKFYGSNDIYYKEDVDAMIDKMRKKGINDPV